MIFQDGLATPSHKEPRERPMMTSSFCQGVFLSETGY